jgi:tRNA(Ile)-lysidine synthase
MASSKKLPSNLLHHVDQVLSKRVQPGQHLILGLSGGADSVVLLDLLARLRASLGFRLSALHVNHQISARSGDWAAFCAELCDGYGISLKTVQVDVTLGSGDSLEEAARIQRHGVFSRHRGDFVVLAHHLDDQAETLLLQLLRGCGVEGASAMAEENRHLLRPLLEVPRATLEHYGRLHGLAWVEDESNEDTRFDRNFLRHRLLPVLEQRFPAYRETLLRASRHFAESAALQEELARHDALTAIADGKLSVHGLAALSPLRAKNLLRYFLRQQSSTVPPAARLEDMLRQLFHARRDAQVKVAYGSFELRRFMGQAWVIPSTIQPDPALSYSWQGESELDLPELGGRLKFWSVHGQGISLARLSREAVTIRLRQGGERLQPDCRRPRRSLKNLFQEASMPPWTRLTLPLLYSGDNLVAAMGLGVDCGYQAEPDEAGIMWEWLAS